MSSDDGNDEEKALRDRVAKAIREAIVDQVRASAAQVEIPCDKIRAVFDTALNEGDRAAAILLFALAEDTHQEMFERHLNPQVREGVKSLMGSNGPLGTAHNRIAMAAGLYWMEKRTYQSLDLMRKIRNSFAHDVDCSSFTHRRILGWITSMPPLEEVLEVSDARTREKYSARDLFFIRSMVAICRMFVEAAALPFASRVGVASATLLKDWDSHPDNLRKAQLLAAEYAIHIDLNGSSEPPSRPLSAAE